MKTKLIPAIVIGLCVLLFSTQAVGEAESFRNDSTHAITATELFSDIVNRVLPSVCMVLNKAVVSTTKIDNPKKENQNNAFI